MLIIIISPGVFIKDNFGFGFAICDIVKGLCKVAQITMILLKLIGTLSSIKKGDSSKKKIWLNRPFLRFLVSLFQNEYSCKIFHMKVS